MADQAFRADDFRKWAILNLCLRDKLSLKELVLDALTHDLANVIGENLGKHSYEDMRLITGRVFDFLDDLLPDLYQTVEGGAATTGDDYLRFTRLHCPQPDVLWARGMQFREEAEQYKLETGELFAKCKEIYALNEGLLAQCREKRAEYEELLAQAKEKRAEADEILLAAQAKADSILRAALDKDGEGGRPWA
jgi:hypothetical protein